MAVLKKEKKQNVFEKLKKYYSNVSSEMRKVSWPSKEELKESTIVVITVTGILAAFAFCIDFVVGEVVKQFFK